jgi:DNA mismatch endonuclease (patch repair protein)
MHQDCKHFVVPKSNTTFWMNKIQANVDRDARNYTLLEKAGWQTVVIWECIIESNPAAAVQQILEKNQIGAFFTVFSTMIITAILKRS